MKKYIVRGIKYDTTGTGLLPEESVTLPKNLTVYCDDEEEVIDTISDWTGYLVESVESIEEKRLHKR